jgi:hypothetical protein
MCVDLRKFDSCAGVHREFKGLGLGWIVVFYENTPTEEFPEGGWCAFEGIEYPAGMFKTSRQALLSLDPDNPDAHRCPITLTAIIYALTNGAFVGAQYRPSEGHGYIVTMTLDEDAGELLFYVHNPDIDDQADGWEYCIHLDDIKAEPVEAE